ncbi:WxL domain-containing protein [Enterococcus faecalis]|uniref:WxL domain-containing protein n=1 Tax=Enterococcus TaxID=1350 RepID=UPI0019FF39EE|nr:WxL domain-containing protein [Enterococcus faecalis]EGO2576732.1 WxL domain-containing protein [Enterococcus faecalis]EGO7505420.1 WxL domain-containing protein [Enterococcus faecalis]WHK69834.1 WxL domain-containing protein [Enterococcus faecalis]
MKQTKRQRLATIGLCSSLVINAFSGVTAVAETVTIESSPTAESSAKEETPASSMKEETTKASTENSQVTTDTSQEEATKEAEKQAETEVKEEQKEEPQAEVEQAETATNSSENDLQKSLSPRWVPNNQVIYPRMIFAFTDETGKAFADENLTLSGTYYKVVRNNSTLKYYTSNGTRYPIVSSNAGNGQYRVAVNAAVPLPYDFYTNVPTGYSGNRYLIEQLKVDNTLKYVDSIVAPPGRITLTTYTSQQTSEAAQFGNYTTYALSQRDRTFSKNSANIFSLNTALTTDPYDHLNVMGVGSMSSMGRLIPLLQGFDGTATYRETLNYVITRKQVTEKFVNTSGVAITPPTGFTQNKKTPMTSNAFTFKQAGTLPDTYTTGGKTYKFKGWYKGKTKTEPLKTTKAPSYGVTYDDNDDLNVVYEEINFPEVTYQFGFVNEAGQLVNPADIKITYDHKSQSFRGQGGLPTDTISDDTILANQSAATVGNLKNVTLPATYIPRPTEAGWNGDGYDNFSIKLPRYYQSLNLYDKTGKINPNYPLPVMTEVKSTGNVASSEKAIIANLTLTQRADKSFTPAESVFSQGGGKVTRVRVLSREIYSSNLMAGLSRYYTFGSPAYYHLTNRRVTENFVDTSGAKITPPSGFTQGKQTVITSDPYTFKQAGTLPDSYTTGGKTYKFKGWYKGKSTLNTLTTTKAPSYQVTYDDNDDLNVVYEEETVTTLYPSVDMNFVNEKGGAFTPALTFSGKYYAQSTSASLRTDLYDVTSKNNGSGQYTLSVNNGSMPLSQELLKKYNNGNPISVTNRVQFNIDKLAIDQQLKYVDSIQLDTDQSSNLTSYRYVYTKNSSLIFDPNVAPAGVALSSEFLNLLNFDSDGTYFSNANDKLFHMHLGYSAAADGSNLLIMSLFNANPADKSKLVYKVTRKQVTENFVDANGTKITAPTGFTQGNQVPMNSNTFKYTAAKALPATYTAGGKVYTFQGWYKGKTKPSTLNKTTTPTFNATFDGNDDMTAMYKEEIPTASVTLTRPKEVIDTNTNVIWTTTITNTSKAPLQNLTLKKGPNWSAGLTIPTFMEVTPEGEATKSIPVNSTLWTEGVPLPNAVPIGKKVSIAFTTRATGKPNTVLKAEVVVFGGIKDSAVDNFVRIRPNDQEVVTPTTEGFISVPTFDFGQVGVAGSKQQHSLKKAADYYGNGTRNPYVRIKKTQPNWSLTAQLSQPKSATDSLPTATRLLLGAAPVSSFTNYNQPTELKNAVGTTSAISLTANNTATSIIANKQFTGSNVYQLDFTFNNVKLEVPANQGVKGQQYKAAVTWNLVTGP